jgi:hypothetical protein
VRNGFTDCELQLRNNEKIRKLFCEIICIFCQAKQKHSYSQIKIKQNDFDLTEISDKFKAPSIEYAQTIYLPDDPKELFIAINEFYYNLCKSSVDCCYWLEWIIEFNALKKKAKMPLKCERRIFAKVDTTLQMDIIWILWDILIKESNNKTQFIQKSIQSTFDIFCFRFSQTKMKKLKLLLYFAIEMLTEPFSISEEIVKDKMAVENVKNNIHKIYKQIKKNEHSPGTDYLYNNINANLNDTIHKLETMNTFNEDFLPRIA